LSKHFGVPRRSYIRELCASSRRMPGSDSIQENPWLGPAGVQTDSGFRRNDVGTNSNIWNK
jgi:hypothetical protein